MTGPTPDNDAYPQCGSTSYRGQRWARYWPRESCTLPLGHESDHRFAIWPGDVFFEWSYTAEELTRR